jgi:hypothetical protein
VNIFLLDNNIVRCAQYHCDQHVIKMILESAQILCTVLDLHKIKTPYKPSHQNHPCTLWASQSIQNWLWLKDFVHALNDEYQYRYGSNKVHQSFNIVKELPIPPLPDIGLLEHPQVMPSIYQVSNNPVQAYRNFYIFDKSRFATWRVRKPPRWYVLRKINKRHHAPNTE